MRKVFVTILLCTCLGAFAETEADKFKDLLNHYRELGGKSEITKDQSPYFRVELEDSAVVEMYMTDKITVVYTVCAPVCSSSARVYTKEWNLLDTIKPPFTSVFPIATIDQETGRVIWTDNDSWKY